MSLTVGRGPAALPTPGTGAAGAAGDAQEAKLKKVAEQMAGTFAEQLFKAMRETVPQGEGAFDGGSGEEMFSGLMDQHLAAETPTQWAHGLTDSIVRHLRGALEAQRGGGTPGTQGGAPDGTSSGTSAAPTLRPLHEAATLHPLHPLHPPAKLLPLQQAPQLQPLPDVTR